MSKKTDQLLTYIVKGHPEISITSLMKLSYLVDLVNIGKTDKQVSDFRYTRYIYGPFDHKIYKYLFGKIYRVQAQHLDISIDSLND